MNRPPLNNADQFFIFILREKKKAESTQKKKLWDKVSNKIQKDLISENTEKIIKKIQNKTPFKIAEKYLKQIYDQLIKLLITLLNNNRKCSEHFLSVSDEFLFQKCID